MAFQWCQHRFLWMQVATCPRLISTAWLSGKGWLAAKAEKHRKHGQRRRPDSGSAGLAAHGSRRPRARARRLSGLQSGGPCGPVGPLGRSMALGRLGPALPLWSLGGAPLETRRVLWVWVCGLQLNASMLPPHASMLPPRASRLEAETRRVEVQPEHIWFQAQGGEGREG